MLGDLWQGLKGVVVGLLNNIGSVIHEAIFFLYVLCFGVGEYGV
jgi:hypothetical protein